MKKQWKDFLETIAYLALLICLSLCFTHFIAQRSVVIGSSMENTLQNQDELIVNKLDYYINSPQRFDIVTVEVDKNYYFVKRVIGLPGETVFIDENGTIFINEEPLSEAYGKEPIENPGLAATPIQLAEDEYFVMGDNRNHSEDSRMRGPFKKEQLTGRVILRFYPEVTVFRRDPKE